MDTKSTVTIELFGNQRAVAGTGNIIMPIGKKTVAKDVFRFLSTNFPEMHLDDEKLHLIVNDEIVRPEKVLMANDIVGLIPHIGGG
jgi:molybdopterin converting factor small subunit